MSILIRRAKYHGGDTQLFRAYTTPDDDTGQNYYGRSGIESLNISASTTGNPRDGILRCAAKCFSKIHGKQIPENEIFIEPKPNYQWLAHWPF